MGWQFEIHHVPGRLIPAPDATSRNPFNSLEDVDGISMSAVLEAIRSFEEIDSSMEMGVVAAAKAIIKAILLFNGLKYLSIESGTWRITKYQYRADSNPNNKARRI